MLEANGYLSTKNLWLNLFMDLFMARAWWRRLWCGCGYGCGNQRLYIAHVCVLRHDLVLEVWFCEFVVFNLLMCEQRAIKEVLTMQLLECALAKEYLVLSDDASTGSDLLNLTVVDRVYQKGHSSSQ